MSNPDIDKARRALEALAELTQGDYEEVSPSSAPRVAAIEDARPLVKFLRDEDGGTPFFGIMPEQAMGTIDGLPFYYRFRYDHASLSVFPSQAHGEVLEPADMPTHAVEPVMVADVFDVTGDEYAGVLGNEEGVETFLQLVDGLHVPQGRDTFTRRTAQALAEMGSSITGDALAHPFLTHLSEGQRLDVGEALNSAGRAVLRLSSGVIVTLSVFRSYGEDDSLNLLMRVSTPDSRPFSKGESALTSSTPLGLNPEEEEIMEALTLAVQGLDDERSYIQYTSSLEPERREVRQRLAVEAREEIANAFGLAPMEPERVGQMLARGEMDRIEVLLQNFDKD